MSLPTLLLAMPYIALYCHLKPPYETLSRRESKELEPQGCAGRRDGMAGKLNDPNAAKRRFRYYRNAVTDRLGNACKADLSGYFP